MQQEKTRVLVVGGVFMALTIIFTHIFAIQTPFIRFSFSFLPIALFGSLFGKWHAAMMAMMADLIGGFIFLPMTPFLGFTFSAFLTGLIYGHFLHKPQRLLENKTSTPFYTLKEIALPFIIITIFIDLILNTFWLSIIYHKSAYLFFMSRLIKNLIALPINIFIFSILYKPILNFIRQRY